MHAHINTHTHTHTHTHTQYVHMHTHTHTYTGTDPLNTTRAEKVDFLYQQRLASLLSVDDLVTDVVTALEVSQSPWRPIQYTVIITIKVMEIMILSYALYGLVDRFEGSA